ncbi:MAG: class I SAM-dependent methyltransferase [Acidobacteriota bacterium]
MSLRRLIGAVAPRMPTPLARKLLRGRHPFDLQHGTDTGGLLYARDLPTGHAHDAFNEGYYATAPSLFLGLISRWEDTLARVALRVSDYHFMDLGCGKGRVLLLASELPFRGVTGVELHAGLCASATRNVEHWMRRPRACPLVSVVHGDVLDLALPDEPVVLFLFNSFGAEVMRPLVERLVAAAQRRTAPIDLLYLHPDWAEMVASTPGVETLFTGDIPFSREEALADAFSVASDAAAVYRVGGSRKQGV